MKIKCLICNETIESKYRHNLVSCKCEYCYVIQEDRRKMEPAKLQYDIPTIKKALTKERLGGVCYFSLCGAGETLLQNEISDIMEQINFRYDEYYNFSSIKRMITYIVNDFEKYFHHHFFIIALLRNFRNLIIKEIHLELV